MDFSKNYDKLLDQMKVDFENDKLIHTVNKNFSLFPFKSDNTRATFDKGFNKILGELSRLLLMKESNDILEINDIVSKIISEDIDIEDGTDEYILKLLAEYLFNEKNELKILHPYLYLFIPLSKNKSSVGERDVALFLRDIFCKNNGELINFFKSNDTSHAIVNLILNNTPRLDNKTTETKFFSYLDEIPELFNEDINFALENEKFLLANMENIFAFYYFYYISQLILKLSKGYNDDGKMENLYYLLDWENISKNRKTLNNGYKFLKDKTKPLFAKLSLIDQLNTLFGTKYCLEKDLLQNYNNLDENSKLNLLFYLKKWVGDYRNIRHFEFINLPDNFEDLSILLYESLKDDKRGVDTALKSRYALNLEEIGKKYFLKRRGSYGYVLNINRDMLLVLTALCVKDKKIKLNQLFIEFEKRGVYFDKYSKEEVVDFLTKLNLIDKKSDSGDAQYVKPVL